TSQRVTKLPSFSDLRRVCWTSSTESQCCISGEYVVPIWVRSEVMTKIGSCSLSPLATCAWPSKIVFSHPAVLGKAILGRHTRCTSHWPCAGCGVRGSPSQIPRGG